MRKTYLDIQNQIKKEIVTQQGLIISEPNIVRETSYYKNEKTVFVVGAYFTTKPVYVFAILNGNTDIGELFYINGVFDQEEIMSNVCRIVLDCFVDSEIKQQRRIIMDYGRFLISFISTHDSSLAFTQDNDDFQCNVHINTYQVLVDVDWIEETMENLTGSK